MKECLSVLYYNFLSIDLSLFNWNIFQITLEFNEDIIVKEDLHDNGS